MSDQPKNDEVQGEGDYKSAKKFDDAEQAFVKSGGVEKAAGQAAPKSAGEAKELDLAEKIGRSHSKGEDPAVLNPKSQPKSQPDRDPK